MSNEQNQDIHENYLELKERFEQMEKELKEADEILLDVLYQACADVEKGLDVFIDNQCISAYEDACKYLEKKGLLKSNKGNLKLYFLSENEYNLPVIYFCKKCNRYTDVRYLQDKQGDRPKSYCYKCHDEMLEPVTIERK